MIDQNDTDIGNPFRTDDPGINKRILDKLSFQSGNYWHLAFTLMCVAKAKSLSGAAEMLGSSHATVGREIRRLRDILGAQLFISTNSGITLTPMGEEVVEEALRSDTRWAALQKNLSAERSGMVGTVRLSITDGLGAIFVVPSLRRLTHDYPGILVEIKTPDNLRKTEENQTDIMLGFAPDPSPLLTTIEAGWLHFIPIVSKDYVASRGFPTLSDISKHDFVDSALYSARGGPFEPWHQLTSLGKVAMRSDNSISYGMMVKSGLGIGLLGSYIMLEPEARPLDLGVHIKLRLFISVLTERLASPPVKTVYTFMQELFSVENHWFQEALSLELNAPAYASEGYDLLFNIKRLK